MSSIGIVILCLSYIITDFANNVISIQVGIDDVICTYFLPFVPDRSNKKKCRLEETKVVSTKFSLPAELYQQTK